MLIYKNSIHYQKQTKNRKNVQNLSSLEFIVYIIYIIMVEEELNEIYCSTDDTGK